MRTSQKVAAGLGALALAPEKPAELPKTGGEGVDPAPIALLVGVATAAGAAALRSRKH